jgi:ATP-dependent Clp protease ATP-binding subunit ClpA
MKCSLCGAENASPIDSTQGVLFESMKKVAAISGNKIEDIRICDNCREKFDNAATVIQQMYTSGAFGSFGNIAKNTQTAKTETTQNNKEATKKLNNENTAKKSKKQPEQPENNDDEQTAKDKIKERFAEICETLNLSDVGVSAEQFSDAVGPYMEDINRFITEKKAREQQDLSDNDADTDEIEDEQAEDNTALDNTVEVKPENIQKQSKKTPVGYFERRNFPGGTIITSGRIEANSKEDVKRMFSDIIDNIPGLLGGNMGTFGGNGDEEDDDDGSGGLPFNIQDFFEGAMGYAPFGNGFSNGTTHINSKDVRKKRFIDNYCTNLTEKARKGGIDRVIGRERELRRVVQILCRRTKNNPCLIGEPGVGKTAIAEGLALKISSGDIPEKLKGKEVYLLDLTVLLAGTQFRGQYEQRVKQLLEDVKTAGNIILFIDEVHGLVSSGSSDSAMNAANMFKPALSRGEMQVVGATTFTEYRKYIEKDAALERRFQPVIVGEPSVEDTIELLTGIKDYYEKFHGLSVGADVIEACAVLSERYITDRFLPDKAIDLLDEACVNCIIKNPFIGEYKRLDKEVHRLRKLIFSKSVEEPKDYKKIAELKTDGARKEKRLKEIEPHSKELRVSIGDVAEAVELWTGIPASKITESEFERLRRLEETLKAKVVGQDIACAAVAKAVRRSRVQLTDSRRPASFIFVGPTGVGKTELVKQLANELFFNPDSDDKAQNEPLIRLDMSEFMEKHSVSRIIGAPPGYVGYEDAGQLTEKIRRKPYSVVLLDEIEKAHPDVLNILLQILDEGKIADAHGKTVSFANTVICMTSNAGSTDKTNAIGFGKVADDVTKEKAEKALREFLRPEFLGRIDDVIIFKGLTKENYAEIAKIMLDELRAPKRGEKELAIDIAESVYGLVAEKSHGKKFGGRDIRNVIRNEIEDKIADILIERDDYPTKITVDAADGVFAIAAE